jgi:TatA/E family protein of Tat protein translocase
VDFRGGEKITRTAAEIRHRTMLSPSDTAIVFVLALLLFGPEQLPKLARQLGEAMRHIQSTTNTFMMEMERAADAAQPNEHVAPLEIPHVPEEMQPPPAESDGVSQPPEVVGD